jgi:prepilin-type N-terminal cleavage/methylation domain-containing protein
MSRSKQKGFTLFELSVVLAIISLMSVFLVPVVKQRLQAGKLEAAISQASNILQSCEMARQKAITSSIDAKGTATHTYASIPNWAGTDVVETQVGAGIKLPRNNLFGNPILVKNDSNRCYVAVDLDFLLSNATAYTTQIVNGNTRIIISTRPKLGAGVDWVIQQKRLLNKEATR